jgi:hypothetical protein
LASNSLSRGFKDAVGDGSSVACMQPPRSSPMPTNANFQDAIIRLFIAGTAGSMSLLIIE